jgi:hypothetical protein
LALLNQKVSKLFRIVESEEHWKTVLRIGNSVINSIKIWAPAASAKKSQASEKEAPQPGSDELSKDSGQREPDKNS